MSTTTTERPFALGVGAGGTWRGTAPDLRTAILKAEAETGGRVWAGGSTDGGVPRFDPDGDVRDWIASRSGRPTTARSKPLPDEYAATQEGNA